MKRIVKILKETYQVNPLMFTIQYAASIIAAITTGYLATLMDRLFSDIIEIYNGEKVFSDAVIILLLIWVLYISSEIMTNISIYISGYYDTCARQQRASEFHLLLGKLLTSAFDSPDILDKINGAYAGIGDVRLVAHYIIEFATFYIPYFVVYGIYLAKVSPLLLCMIPLMFVPLFLGQIIKSKYSVELAENVEGIMRKRDAYFSYISVPEIAKETRLVGATEFFTNEYCKLGRHYNSFLKEFFWKNNRIDMIGQIMKFVGYGVIFVILIWGVFSGSIGIASFAAIFSSITILSNNCEELVCEKFSALAESWGYMKAYFMIESLQPEEENMKPIDKIGNIVMNNVSFSYSDSTENRFVIKDVSLNIHSGQRIALVGENGSGKTTLTKLLLGLYKPQKGEILYNGKHINAINSRSVLDKGTAVFQAFGKYKMTLRENIAISNLNATDEEIIQKLQQTAFDENYEKLPDSINTVLGKEFGGTELSGGQWQNIAIARGLLKESELLVLDEPTAAIDAVSEHKLYATLLEATKGKTAIIVTHRLALAKQCERIIVMNKGKIIADGNHEYLLKHSKEYSEQWKAQAEGWENTDV